MTFSNKGNRSDAPRTPHRAGLPVEWARKNEVICGTIMEKSPKGLRVKVDGSPKDSRYSFAPIEQVAEDLRGLCLGAVRTFKVTTSFTDKRGPNVYLSLLDDQGTAQSSSPIGSRGASSGANVLDDRKPCQNYLLGLCTRPHPSIDAQGVETCCRDPHEPRPAGYGQWLVNRDLANNSPDRYRGWVYGGLLAEANDGQDAALAYRRVGVDAIEALRQQYKKVMGKDGDFPFPPLFFAYPDEPPAPNGVVKELWTSKSADTDLPGAVIGIRRLVEVLLGENYRLRASGAAEKYLLGDDREDRWRKLYFHAKSLNRNSDAGADVPLQWSAHAQLNPYDHTEVTELTLVEIVAKLGVILEQLFTERIPCGVKVYPRAVAPALQAAFAAPSILDKKSKRKNAAHKNPSDVFAAAMKKAAAA